MSNTNNPKPKEGSIIVIIGQMGQGKSPYLKNLIAKSEIKNKVVYDRRREYDKNEFTLFYDLKYFKEELPKLEQSFIIVEEASGFVRLYSDMELKDTLIGCQHNLNIITFIFHRCMDAPTDILDLCDFVILFKTGDEESKIESSRPRLLEAFKKEKKQDGNGWNIPEVIQYNNL